MLRRIKNFLTLRLIKLSGKNKNGRGLIPHRGSCLLSTQQTEDRLRHASGPVQPSVPLHEYFDEKL